MGFRLQARNRSRNGRPPEGERIIAMYRNAGTTMEHRPAVATARADGYRVDNVETFALSARIRRCGRSMRRINKCKAHGIA